MKVELSPAEFRDVIRGLVLSMSDYESRKNMLKAVAAEAVKALQAGEITKEQP